MPDDLPSESTAGAPPAVKKKRKLSFKMKMALLEVIERKRLSYAVDYASISAKYGVANNSLRHTYRYWKKGDLDLGDPQTPEEKRIDMRAQHEQKLELVDRYSALLLKMFQRELIDMEDRFAAAGNGEPPKLDDSQLPRLNREIKSVTDLRETIEKGYNALLEEMRGRTEKQLLPSATPAPVRTRVLTADDELKALEVLGEAIPPTENASES